MVTLLVLLLLTAVVVVPLLMDDHRQASAEFCKIECIEHQARASKHD